MSRRPSRTLARRREFARREAERLELLRLSHASCVSCSTGVHDPGYGDDGVCRCRCCDVDLTDEGYPCLQKK